MDSESSESRALGCWDGPAAAAGLVDLHGDLSPKPDFEPGDGYRDFLLDIGYGKGVTTELVQKWGQSLQETYSGDEGKRRICAAAVCLTTRDGLHKRLPQIRCPVLWLQVGNTNVCLFLMPTTNLLDREPAMLFSVLRMRKPRSSCSRTRPRPSWSRWMTACTS